MINELDEYINYCDECPFCDSCIIDKNIPELNIECIKKRIKNEYRI